MLTPTARFSTRVANYVRYRPGYPAAVIDWLRAECGLAPSAVVADIGSGTGKLAELFLRNGNRVIGVEPNREMREAGERELAGFPDFVSIDGAAEATTLPAACADFITAGQSFHWFEPEPTRREFARILRPGGWVAVVWNARAMTSPFQQAYEELLLEFCPEYTQVNHRDVSEDDLRGWLGLEPFLKASFANGQSLDFDGLAGRLLSSSYAPEPGHANHAPMMAALTSLFARFQADGRVQFAYETEVYAGQMGAAHRAAIDDTCKRRLQSERKVDDDDFKRTRPTHHFQSPHLQRQTDRARLPTGCRTCLGHVGGW